MKPTVIYKVRKKGTDLYSSGGSSPRWTRKGKSWSNLGHVKTHLAQFNARVVYRDAEIVTCEIQVTGTQDVLQLIQDVEAATIAKRKKEADRIAQARKDRDLADLRRLQTMYPNAV